ncbi:MAG: carboxylesterase/lipase family protein [Steroidobacteraceae bacterium]
MTTNQRARRSRLDSVRFTLFASWLALAGTACLRPAIAATAAPPAGASLVVATSAGRIRGLARPGGGAEFLGIPYAEPPVGKLRWSAPVPARPWKGIRPAIKFGAPCAQPVLGAWNRRDAAVSQENCLYLNVIVPHWPLRKSLPVMFWIHGGANLGGSGRGDLYNNGTLVRHGVVLVTINYRLGIFGFFAHPALTRESPHDASGNYGLMDQILALRWVRANIARFGGDPRNITVFGQSAGAGDIGMLMASRGKSLFQKAIQESGSPIGRRPQTLMQAEQAGVRLAAALRAPPGDAAIPYLRAIAARALLAKMKAVGARADLSPEIDGWVLSRAPGHVFMSGRESGIPLLFGTTTRELASSQSLEQLQARVRRYTGPFAPQVLATYGLARGDRGISDPKYGDGPRQLYVDVGFRCPAVLEAIWHTAAGHGAYEYEFDHAIPGQPFAVHSSELPYVFGFFPRTGNLAGPFTPTDSRLADLIETYWTNFARTGNPNSKHVPEWPPFGRRRNYIEFLQDGAVARAQDLRAMQCALYRKYRAWQVAHPPTE